MPRSHGVRLVLLPGRLAVGPYGGPPHPGRGIPIGASRRRATTAYGQKKSHRGRAVRAHETPSHRPEDGCPVMTLGRCDDPPGWRPAESCSRSSRRNPQVAARISLAGGPVGARRAGTSGDRTTDRSGTYRTAPKRRRRTGDRLHHGGGHDLRRSRYPGFSPPGFGSAMRGRLGRLRGHGGRRRWGARRRVRSSRRDRGGTCRPPEGPGTGRGDVATDITRAAWGETGETGAESGAPVDRVHLRGDTDGSDDPGARDAVEYRPSLAPQELGHRL